MTMREDCCKPLFFLVPLLFVFISVSYGYLNIEQYCRAFDENFRPVICLIKDTSNQNSGIISGGTNTSTVVRPVNIPDPIASIERLVLLKHKLKPKLKTKLRPRPHRPRPPPHHQYWPADHEDEWEDDDESDCSCDFKCWPVVNATGTNGISYRCGTCGTGCWVWTQLRSNCSCAVPTNNGNVSCACSATCASFRSGLGLGDLTSSSARMGGWGWSDDDDDSSDDDSGEDLNCIFTISNFTDTSTGTDLRPFLCSCCKSTAAETTGLPDFVCICQRIAPNWRRVDVDLDHEEDGEEDKEKSSDILRLSSKIVENDPKDEIVRSLNENGETWKNNN